MVKGTHHIDTIVFSADSWGSLSQPSLIKHKRVRSTAQHEQVHVLEYESLSDLTAKLTEFYKSGTKILPIKLIEDEPR